ncbi:hypothetical protein D3C80_1928030 [compost metagenome]
MRAPSTASAMNITATASADRIASRRWRAALPRSKKNSMRILRSRATAALPATSASTIIRKTENSSVQANDSSVK